MQIYVAPSPVLRRQAAPVTLLELQDTATRLAKSMLETMHAANGRGLAAPQVGVGKRVFVFTWLGEDYVVINPVVLSMSEPGYVPPFEEGCLSVDEKKTFPIERFRRVTLLYSNADLKDVLLEAEDELAVVLQHELDHLNGVLILDRVKEQREKNDAV